MRAATIYKEVTPMMSLTRAEGWTVVDQQNSRYATKCVLTKLGTNLNATLERCAHGRLRDAYPVAEHDIEIRFDDAPTDELTALLGALSAAVQQADPQCRRVVFGAPRGDVATLTAAENTGFRYVVDVDLAGASLSLAVAEPSWVTSVDMDLDRVPGT
jgi:hypothetical protein